MKYGYSRPGSSKFSIHFFFFKRNRILDTVHYYCLAIFLVLQILPIINISVTVSSNIESSMPFIYLGVRVSLNTNSLFNEESF